MKVVIEIPDDDYVAVRCGDLIYFGQENLAQSVTNAFQNSIPYEERPKGTWHHSGECPFCRKRSLRTTPLGDIIGIDLSDFCKNCGADMRGDTK